MKRSMQFVGTAVKLLVAVAFFCWSLPVIAHGEEEHDTVQTEQGQTTHKEVGASLSVMAPLSDFPNLHPLVVHFPIVLLILAFISQVFGFFVMKKELSWVTLALLLFGFIGAWIAANYAHAHPHNMPDQIHEIFETHEWYASLTIWASGIALLLKAVSLFVLKRKMWLEILVAIALLVSAGAVSIAGHLGSQLVHVEGVGPQGKYLEQEGEHQH